MAVEHGTGDVWGGQEPAQPTPEYDSEQELLSERSGWFYVVRIFLALASLTFIVQQLWPRAEESPAAPTHPSGVLEDLAQGVEGVTKGFSNLASEPGHTVGRALDKAAARLSSAFDQADDSASTPSTVDEPAANEAVLGKVFEATPETGSAGPDTGGPARGGGGVPPPSARPGPAPGPSPDPSTPPPSNPGPSPSPEPSPRPAPPETSPSPDPSPEPDPDPPPAPDPDPPPAPDPDPPPPPDPPPAPDPDPSPAPDPSPSPDPSPAPDLFPSPDPSPSGDPQPSPPGGGPSPSPTATPNSGP